MVTTIVIVTRISDTHVNVVYCNDLDANEPSIAIVTTDAPADLIESPDNIPTTIGQVKHYTV